MAVGSGRLVMGTILVMKVARFALTCAVAGLALTALAQTAPRPRPEPSDPARRAQAEPGALAWLRQNAVPFAADTPTRAELEPLVKALEGTRVYGLGEPTHGDQQSSLFKTHLIRELVRQGKIDSLMFEINRLPGEEFDAFVNEGKGDIADLMVNSGLFAIWKTDEVANLLLWLRAWVQRTGKPIRIYGIDCQDSARDLRDAIDWVARHDRRQAAAWRKQFAGLLDSERPGADALNWLMSQPKGSGPGLLKALREVVTKIQTTEQWKSKPGHAEAVYLAELAWQEVHTFELEIGGGGARVTSAPGEYYGRRDRHMGRNLLNRLGDKHRAALWAHDSHVVSTLSPLAVVAGISSVGNEVKKVLKDEYISVGFAWREGVINAKFFDGNYLAARTAPFVNTPLLANRPGDLGEFLGRVGPERFWVDLRRADDAFRAWSKLGYYRGWVGFGLNPARFHESANEVLALTECHEILVYTQRLSPSTLWSLPPKPASER